MNFREIGKSLGDTLLALLGGVVRHPRLEREIAFVVDICICLTITIFPNKAAVVLSVAYFIFRDCFRISGERMSFGKRLYGIRIVRSDGGGSPSWRVTLLRNLFLCVPVLNLIDICSFIYRGKRLVDDWLGTDVVVGSLAEDDGQ